MIERKKICKIRIGSHLYGTNRPESDQDFCGIFLPSEDDLLGLQNQPQEMSEAVKVSTGPRNEAGDIDCKFYSLQRFINLAGQGQPGQLEMLFAPDSMIEQTSDEWQALQANRHLFLSSSGISPFIGFALAQAHKTCLKGDNLNRLLDVLNWGTLLTSAEQREKISSYMIKEDGDMFRFSVQRASERNGELGHINQYTEYTFQLKANDYGFSCLDISGRQYDTGASVKTILKQLQTLVEKYGTRSKAAAEFGLDYKSLMHAYRLMYEAEEFVATGNITLPRPTSEVVFLKRVRNMEIPVEFDWYSDIEHRIDHIRQNVQPKSPLPEKPDWSKLGELCRSIQRKHLKG